MHNTRVEVSQTKWSEGMQDYITSGVEYIVFPILNVPYRTIGHYFAVHAPMGKGMRYYPLWPVFFFLKEYPSVELENKERIDAIRKADEEIHANFWRIQGDILGSQA